MKIISIIALLFSFVTTPALADNTGKMYIGGDLGSSSFSNISPFPNPGVIRFVFGSQFSPNLAAEIGYSVFGDSTYSGPGGSATLSATALQFAAIGILPLNPQFDLTGKLGFSHNYGKITSTIGIYGDESNNSLLFGVGAQFHLNSQIAFRLTYDDYGDFDSNSPAISATSISLGLLYNF
jgi:opacity protein-like surface antigen